MKMRLRRKAVPEQPSIFFKRLLLGLISGLWKSMSAPSSKLWINVLNPKSKKRSSSNGVRSARDIGRARLNQVIESNFGVSGRNFWGFWKFSGVVFGSLEWFLFMESVDGFSLG
jgi:hypothetical protein